MDLQKYGFTQHLGDGKAPSLFWSLSTLSICTSSCSPSWFLDLHLGSLSWPSILAIHLGSPSWIWSIWCFSFLTYLELIVFVFLDVSIEVSKWTYCSSPLLASMKEKSKHVSTTIVLFNLIIYKKLRIHFLRTWHLHNIFEMYIA